MGVVVDQMTSETMPDATSAPAATSALSAAPSGSVREVDMSRLDFALARQRHRIERRWAD